MEKVGKNVTIEKVQRLDKEGLIRRNLDHAPLKDTVTVPDGGYTIVRFYADNPGTIRHSTLQRMCLFKSCTLLK